MNIQLRDAIVAALRADPGTSQVIDDITYGPDGTGTLTYAPNGVWVDPSAPGFAGTKAAVTDEELVRAYLLVRLATTYSYPARPEILEVERVYKPVGRPTGKGGRIDVVVRTPAKGKRSSSGTTLDPFLFIECKAPDKFDSDLKMIDGQLFRLSRQELPAPKHLVYYTVELKTGRLRERLILIDTATFPDFASWDGAGQPITDTIPAAYGKATKRRYANVPAETEGHQPLDKAATEETFNRLRTEIHDVIWAGGGTNNNEVFVLITRLILCKIFDEQEATPGSEYRFQRLGDAVEPESSTDLVARLNDLYREAEGSYLALPQASEGPAFDPARISADKIAYVVGRLEGLSVTENEHSGDLLGEFFEQIVAGDFTQTKGQFFTPIKVVRFMLALASAQGRAREIMLKEKDHLGRPRLPYVIDPSCGSGTFLIEYMKLLRGTVGDDSTRSGLPRRVREAHEGWFAGRTGNAWAQHFLFAIENNYDLGLAAKVNMVLHGDGSMNTWIRSALDPFEDYWVDGRHNILGTTTPGEATHPYKAARNDQFDLVISNPPFSLKLSPDEKARAVGAFDVMAAANSEAVFIERWYQLLREGGTFCCVLPEAILDTATSHAMRVFLIRYFRIRAVVSLPYDAFRPFTSTKTAIVLAEKRPTDEVRAFNKALSEAGGSLTATPTPVILKEALRTLGWDSEPIFMAEPVSAGYKRRKNLPDLALQNDLYREDGTVDPANPATVLDAWLAGASSTADPSLGFTTTLGAVADRAGFRLDPKYRWLWDFMHGVAWGPRTKSVPLGDLVDLVDLARVKKGELAIETTVVDLEYVEGRQAIVRPDVPRLDEIGSDKVSFRGCDIAVSKLEPYLGKLLLQPREEWIGTPEWIGLKIRGELPPILLAYLLMLPDTCSAMRRLQSGKRHARLNPEELLELRLQVPPESAWSALVEKLTRTREALLELRRQAVSIRAEIDTALVP